MPIELSHLTHTRLLTSQLDSSLIILNFDTRFQSIVRTFVVSRHIYPAYKDREKRCLYVRFDINYQ